MHQNKWAPGARMAAFSKDPPRHLSKLADEYSNNEGSRLLGAYRKNRTYKLQRADWADTAWRLRGIRAAQDQQASFSSCWTFTTIAVQTIFNSLIGQTRRGVCAGLARFKGPYNPGAGTSTAIDSREAPSPVYDDVIDLVDPPTPVTPRVQFDPLEDYFPDVAPCTAREIADLNVIKINGVHVSNLLHSVLSRGLVFN
uniref:Pept_C1 domain-containing protein n=1 Tax=Globodera pallida TaxID=36090 RepID=A0A183BMB3_GLOPA